MRFYSLLLYSYKFLTFTIFWILISKVSNVNSNLCLYKHIVTFINTVTIIIILSSNIISTDKFAKICLFYKRRYIWKLWRHSNFLLFLHLHKKISSIGSATSKLCYYYIVLKKFVCRHNFTYLPLRKIYLIPQFKTIYIYSCLLLCRIWNICYRVFMKIWCVSPFLE